MSQIITVLGGIMEILLTQSQTAIYANEKLLRESTAYNVPFVITFDKTADTEKLAKAVEKIVSAHPALRCIIENNSDGQPCLKDTERKITLECHDIKAGEFERIKKNLIRPFRLDESLCRFELYNAPDRKYFFFDIHHVIIDGPSLHSLCSEIVNYLNNNEDIQPENYTVFDMTEDEYSLRESENYKNAQKYFGKLLEEAKPTVCR